MRNDIKEAIKVDETLHPKRQPCDVLKLLYEAAFGSTPMIQDEQSSRLHMMEERNLCAHKKKERPQRISAEYYRVPLSYMKEEDIPLWNHLFLATCKHADKHTALFAQCIREIEEEHKEYFKDININEEPHHSQLYNEIYQPHVRLIKAIYVDHFSCIKAITEVYKKQQRCMVAIDGRCCSGKSTLANALQELFTGHVFHLDDFYLPQKDKTEKRLKKAGGNIDYERFQREVLNPLKEKKTMYYQPFDCHSQSLKEPRILSPTAITIIEGSYAMHPYFENPYDITIAMYCEHEEQKRRLQLRSPNLYQRFIDEWIVLEEHYFNTYRIWERADIVIHTTKMQGYQSVEEEINCLLRK